MLAEQVVSGDRRALARTLTLVEDGAETDVRTLAARLHPHTGAAMRIGMTGAPGVGKSTLTSALTTVLRRRGRTVGVLAVDPSSAFTGGALLGDRIRMADHTLDPGVYVRSMASRGQLGGLSWAAPQALDVLDAAGFDVIVLETVGVGQAEVEVAGVADTTVVVMAPGMGDAIQAAKAGILEVADVLAVNKADRDGAARTIRELEEMQRLGHGPWRAPVVATVAAPSAGAAVRGVDELVDAIMDHHTWLRGDDRIRDRRLGRARQQIRAIALAALRTRMGALEDGGLLDELAREVADRRLDPYTAADTIASAVGGDVAGT